MPNDRDTANQRQHSCQIDGQCCEKDDASNWAIVVISSMVKKNR